MLIRARILAMLTSVLSRPVLVPLFVATGGFWYGVNSLSGNLFQFVLGINDDKVSTPSRRKGNISALLIGGLTFYIRGFVFFPTDVKNPQLSKPLSVKNITDKLKSVNIVKNVNTVFISGIISSLTSSLVKKYGE